MRSAIIVFLFAAVAFASIEEKSADPYIVVTKTVSHGDVVLGTPVTVTVTASNIGQQTAHNVQLIDQHPQAGESALTKSADKLANGENVTITYSFTPSDYGTLSVGVAECTYSPTAGDLTTLKSVSNYVREHLDLYRTEEIHPIRHTIEVMTQEQFDRIYSSKYLEFAAYLLLSAVSVVVPYLLYKSKLAQVDTLLREARKKL